MNSSQNIITAISFMKLISNEHVACMEHKTFSPKILFERDNFGHTGIESNTVLKWTLKKIVGKCVD
jgi:hypothetical protein